MTAPQRNAPPTGTAAPSPHPFRSVFVGLLLACAPASPQAADDGMARHWLKLDQQRQDDRLEAEQRQIRRTHASGTDPTGRMAVERELRRERLDQQQLFRRQEHEQTGLRLRTAPAARPDGPRLRQQTGVQRQMFQQRREQLRLHRNIQRRSRGFGQP